MRLILQTALTYPLAHGVYFCTTPIVIFVKTCQRKSGSILVHLDYHTVWWKILFLVMPTTIQLNEGIMYLLTILGLVHILTYLGSIIDVCRDGRVFL